MDTYGSNLISAAIKQGIVQYNRHGVGSFELTVEQSNQFNYSHNIYNGRIDNNPDGCFQVRKRTARRAGYLIFNL